MNKMKHKVLIWTLLIATLLIVGCSNQSQNTSNGNLQNTQNNPYEIDNNGFSNFVPLEYKGTSEDFMIENLGKDVFDKYVSVVKDEDCIDNGEPECYIFVGYAFNKQKNSKLTNDESFGIFTEEIFTELYDGNSGKFIYPLQTRFDSPFGIFTELYDRNTKKFIKLLQSRVDKSTDEAIFISGGQIIFTDEFIEVCESESPQRNQLCRDLPMLKKNYDELKYDEKSELSISLSMGGIYMIYNSEPYTKQTGKTKIVNIDKTNMKILNIDESEWAFDY